MKEENMRFGENIKTKRMKDSRELTLKEVAQQLEMSLSMLSDIEQRRRKPFNADKIEKFCDYLHLGETDKALMYDLAAKDRREIPSDIEDTMMYSDIGNMARFALRMTNAGYASKKDWEAFVKQIKEKKEKDN